MHKILLFPILLVILGSCSKEPGIGGESTIYGKVYAHHYNSTFTVLLSSYYVPDTYAYLVYGDDVNYGTRIKTNYNGEYEFEFLYPGDYTVYTYSLDSTAIVNGIPDPPETAVMYSITISDNGDMEVLPDLQIFQ